MNQKQLATIEKLESYIRTEVIKLSTSPRHKVDSLVFRRIEKNLLTWAQNANPRSIIDESEEIQQLLEYLTHIVISPFGIRGLLEITHNYNMTNCQLVLVKGIFQQRDFGIIDHNMLINTLRICDSHFLPETKSYVSIVA